MWGISTLGLNKGVHDQRRRVVFDQRDMTQYNFAGARVVGGGSININSTQTISAPAPLPSAAIFFGTIWQRNALHQGRKIGTRARDTSREDANDPSGARARE